MLSRWANVPRRSVARYLICSAPGASKRTRPELASATNVVRGLELTCPSCRHSNPAGSRFCNQCGAFLGATRTPPAPRLPSPESYTPKYLAEKILTSRAALEGERKQFLG